MEPKEPKIEISDRDKLSNINQEAFGLNDNLDGFVADKKDGAVVISENDFEKIKSVLRRVVELSR
ncbi:MAG: hypothetical protein Q8Q89_03715 [bacterium]|nr:hypothetical protein [bacterium]